MVHLKRCQWYCSPTYHFCKIARPFYVKVSIYLFALNFRLHPTNLNSQCNHRSKTNWIMVPLQLVTDLQCVRGWKFCIRFDCHFILAVDNLWLYFEGHASANPFFNCWVKYLPYLLTMVNKAHFKSYLEHQLSFCQLQCMFP